MAQGRAPWLICALLLLLSVGVMCELDGLDDPSASTEPAAVGGTAAKVDPFQQPVKTTNSAPAAAKPQKSTRTFAPPPKVGKYEMLAGLFLIFYVINVLLGRYKNHKISQAWAQTFAEPGGIFDKNFSSLGAGKEKLIQEAGNCFKFYASGRRHVLGLLATLNLKARQDVLTLLWYIISPAEDLITLEAYMTDTSMPPIVVAVGQPKAIRRLAQDQLDVLKYTKKMQAPKDSVPGWPNDKLHIHAEHSNIFTELFSDPRVLNTFNPSGPHAKSLKYVRSLHFTNEGMEGTHKRVLRFTFALPSPANMEDLAPLMALVPLFIDLVGNYKLSPELKKKAENARVKSQENNLEEERKQRQEALLRKKQEKLLEEKAKLARLSPAERQRAEDKLQKKMMEKQLKKRTKVM